ncbi:MAG: hypothetical protein BMS9Abin12_2302 [Acidimicrobiia bacterium]|nr:MAG: hypothetical protein BMS9Abin12_2302 [Acidimicrobiia bacterium]
MTSTLLSRSDIAYWDKDGQPLNVVGKTVFVLIVVYLVMNRVIPDVMVLPIGFSLRPYEVVMAMIIGGWMVWMITEPHPLPTGLVGVVGLALLSILTLAPFLNGLGLSLYQSNGAERGLFRLFLLSGLFMASYHLGYRLRYGHKLLAWVIAVTVFQAVLGIYEFIIKEPLTFIFDFSRNIGLVFDPNAIRTELTNIFARQSGELRATTTAPHPIVLSSVIALSVLLVGVWLIYTNNSKVRRWLAVAGGVLVVALPVANSRTAFVMLAVAALPLAILMIDKLPKLVVWSLAVVLAFGMAFALSPQTPRLLLDSVTRSSEDQNTQIRLERFDRLPELLAPRPILGAGYLTHDPEIQIFDNAYNLGLIEFGILGLIFMIWWFLIALVRSWSATLWATSKEKILTIAGVVTVISLLAASATFDAWTFDQFFPTCLVVLGLALGRSDVVLRRERRWSRPTESEFDPAVTA